MKNRIYSLGEVSRLLHVPPHRVTYQHSTGNIPEPEKILGRRAYRWSEIMILAKHLGVEVEDRGQGGE